MARWRTSYIYTTPRKTFKVFYIFCAILGVFAAVCGLRVIYHDKELTKAKWKGILFGTLVQTAILALVFILCNLANAYPIAIVIFIAYIAHIIAFGVLYGKKDKKSEVVR